MNSRLFYNDDKSDPLWIAKEYFNFIGNRSSFPKIIGYLLSRTGFGEYPMMCTFPDESEADGKFEGVKFKYFDEHLIVSDEVFKALLLKACETDHRVNPDRSLDVHIVLSYHSMLEP